MANNRTTSSRQPSADTPARSELAEAVVRLLLAAVRLRARRAAADCHADVTIEEVPQR